ncbi:MAG: outer membrane lipoprotein carrier protein LolA, partial [Bradyrhizobium sp.]|nr:outer membrane lipoprotein carrier protein LolA [Bradyrhizobium sp.]
MTRPPVTRYARATLALLIAAAVTGAAMPSQAQTVPVPKPAPKGRDVQISASEPPRAPMTTGATQTAPPNPVIPDPRRNVPANIFGTFDADQKAQAARVSSYLSSLQT